MRDIALFVGPVGAALEQCFANDGRAVFAARVEDVDAELRGRVRMLVLRSGPQVSDAMLDLLPRVTNVVRAGSGVDNIDWAELARRGIELHRVPGKSASSVSELGVAALTLLTRQVPLAQAHLYEGRWVKADVSGDSLLDINVAVWGAGAIGCEVFGRLRPLCRAVHFVEWPNLAPELPRKPSSVLIDQADAHVLCLPLRSETRGLVNAAFYARAAPKAPYIVNLGRFELMEWPAAVTALRKGAVRGVFVDPVDKRHVPEVRASLAGAGPLNVMLAPHLGAQRRDVMDDIARTVLRHVDSHIPSPAGAYRIAEPRSAVTT